MQDRSPPNSRCNAIATYLCSSWTGSNFVYLFYSSSSSSSILISATLFCILGVLSQKDASFIHHLILGLNLKFAAKRSFLGNNWQMFILVRSNYKSKYQLFQIQLSSPNYEGKQTQVTLDKFNKQFWKIGSSTYEQQLIQMTMNDEWYRDAGKIDQERRGLCAPAIGTFIIQKIKVEMIHRKSDKRLSVGLFKRESIHAWPHQNWNEFSSKSWKQWIKHLNFHNLVREKMVKSQNKTFFWASS